MLVPASLPVPGVVPDDIGAQVPTFLFAIRINAAVNLLEEREYAGLQRGERIAKALDEQQAFLNSLLDPSLNCAFDLRVLTRPGAAVPIDIALIGRTWGSSEQSDAAIRTEALVRQVHALLPRHVTASIVEERDEVLRLLWPFRPDQSIDTAAISKHEILGSPTRPDAKVPYYFSVVPFNWAQNDWTSLFAALAATQSAVLVSVALLPIQLPPAFTQRLNDWATFFSRLAREDERDGGLYFGQQKLPPDAFAVDAERTFQDFARRYGTRAFVLRIQMAAEDRLPPGLLESFAATVSPTDQSEGNQLERQRAASSYEIRRPTNEFESSCALWNLKTIDFRLLPGRSEIWKRPDAPSQDMQLLSVLGDARDANCAFRFPVAIDGTVPGFRVRRGHFGHVEAYATEGPAITIGNIPGRTDTIRLPVRSLTKHTLVAGSTGSGKTTTVLELLRQLWVDHHVPFLVIEPVNSDADDYRKLLREPGFEDLEVYTVGDEAGRPLRLNPFEVPRNVLVSEHMANLLDCFKAAFGLWEPLPSIYQDAMNLTYAKAGILASERATGEARVWPTAVEFMRSMGKVTAGLTYAGEVRSNLEAASIRRAEQLARGPSGSVFLTNRPNRIAELLDHPVVVELKSLGSGDEQSLMIALLLNAITEHYQAVRGASAELVHVTVVEEAHRLLARPTGTKDAAEAQAKEKAAEAFANTLAENRKYGEGIVIVEQLPTKLVEDAIKNTNLKVMHRLTAEDDRRYLGETMGFDEGQMKFGTRLQTGEALTYSDEFAEATLVSVKPRLESSSLGSVGASANPPFSACELCRAKCHYRGAALAMVRDPDIVKTLAANVAALEKRGLSTDQVNARWSELLTRLRGTVRSFAAMPSDEPGVSDAAYCLFLHSLSIRTMRFAPSWPPSVAKRLGIAQPAT